jgi:hypothetical protein
MLRSGLFTKRFNSTTTSLASGRTSQVALLNFPRASLLSFSSQTPRFLSSAANSFTHLKSQLSDPTLMTAAGFIDNEFIATSSSGKHFAVYGTFRFHWCKKKG